MNFIRARQPTTTRLFPHQGNKRFIIGQRGINAPLIIDPDFRTACAAGVWLCNGTVNIDTVAHQATLGPSTGASERLHQHAPWLIGDRTYRVGIAVVSKSAGSVPFEFHLANDVAALFVEDADVGQHVFADVAVTNPNPHEVGIALLVAGHTLVISEIQARLAP